ncbi:MAG: helix-turn-helix domain-containing protein [Bilophila wadsworthia]
MTPNCPPIPPSHLNMLGYGRKFSNLFSVSFLIKHGTPLARVCRCLCQLSRSHNNAKAFPLDMTQLELASVLDIHRVSLFRCLQQLRELGILVRFSRHEIELSELDQLENCWKNKKAEWG